MDTLSISPTNITAPPYLSIKWETVATESHGVYKPSVEFQQNILQYRHNKFLNIGENIHIFCSICQITVMFYLRNLPQLFVVVQG